MTTTQGRPLRIGLVGTGAISAMHIPAFQERRDDVELVAVCDVREDAARGFAESVGGEVALYSDFETLLERGDIDAVDICTPHDLHAPQTIKSAEAGKHVLVEKPMACSVDECRDMVDAAHAAGVTLMVGQTLRYLPGNRGIRKLIASGSLGRIWWARSDDWFGMLGGEGDEGHAWARDAKRSGGGVLHMGGTHHVDLFRFYFGDVAAARAHCWTDNPLFKNGAEDRAVVTLEFESGVVAQLTACYVPFQTPHSFQYVIFGEKGGLQTTFPEAPNPLLNALYQHHAPAVTSSASAERGESFVPVPPCTDGLVSDQPWTNEIVHFASCVRDRAEPISSGRDNLGTMKAVYACYESARSGREVLTADL